MDSGACTEPTRAQPTMSRVLSRTAAWQTGYLWVYAVWAAIVVIAFPPVFGYI